MSHHHGKTAGPICPKFCTQIHLGPGMFFNFFLLDQAFDGIEWGGKGEGNFSKNHGAALK